MIRRRRQSSTNLERKITDREEAFRRTLQRGVKLLAAKPRSVGELRERLLEKSWTDAEIVEEAIRRLSAYGFLNDNQFANDFAKARLREKPQGRRRLKNLLESKKLSRSNIESALETAYRATPEEELIRLAIQRKISRNGPPQSRDEFKKLFDYLARLGFDFDLIRAALRDVSASTPELPDD